MRIPASDLRAPLCALLLALPFSGARALPPSGFSEPYLTFYGKVTDTRIGAGAQIYLGTLSWTFQPPGATVPFTLSARLQAVPGPSGAQSFSYRLEVPVEKVPAGFRLSDETVGATSADANFAMSVQVNGLPAALRTPANGPRNSTLTFREILRGRFEQIDLQFASPDTGGQDTDGDGIPDAWEIAHGLNPNDPSDADQDLDGDGASNLAEYLAGTDPNCFEWARWVAANYLEGADASPQAAPANDGITNIMAYALGLDPHVSKARLLSQVVRQSIETVSGSKYLTLTVARPGGRTCVVDYAVETSGDLVNWGSVAAQDIVVVNSTPTELKVRDARALGAGTPHRFIRLRITPRP